MSSSTADDGMSRRFTAISSSQLCLSSFDRIERAKATKPEEVSKAKGSACQSARLAGPLFNFVAIIT